MRWELNRLAGSAGIGPAVTISMCEPDDWILLWLGTLASVVNRVESPCSLGRLTSLCKWDDVDLHRLIAPVGVNEQHSARPNAG